MTYHSVGSNVNLNHISLKKNRSDTKVELNLPKAKVTRKGQLLIYTKDQKENEQRLKENILRKSYSNKWFDDVLDNFNLDPSQILSNKVITKKSNFSFY